MKHGYTPPSKLSLVMPRFLVFSSLSPRAEFAKPHLITVVVDI